jgi:hypothetical protein
MSKSVLSLLTVLAIVAGWALGISVASAQQCTDDLSCNFTDGVTSGPMVNHACRWETDCSCDTSDGQWLPGYCRTEKCKECGTSFYAYGYYCNGGDQEACEIANSYLCCDCCS